MEDSWLPDIKLAPPARKAVILLASDSDSSSGAWVRQCVSASGSRSSTCPSSGRSVLVHKLFSPGRHRSLCSSHYSCLFCCLSSLRCRQSRICLVAQKPMTPRMREQKRKDLRRSNSSMLFMVKSMLLFVVRLKHQYRVVSIADLDMVWCELSGLICWISWVPCLY